MNIVSLKTTISKYVITGMDCLAYDKTYVASIKVTQNYDIRN